QARICVRQRWIAVPAVFGSRAILHLTLVGDAVALRAGGLQEVLHQVNRVVQHVGVVRAHVDVQFALQLRTKSSPAALQDRIQVVVVVPVGRGLVVDHAGGLV